MLGLALSQLETGGWVVCHEDAYGDQGVPIADIVSSCAGPYLMLACRPSAASDMLTLAAADARSVVLQADAFGATAHHAANGVGWYFTDTASWGFFPAGATVNRNRCDDTRATADDRRLCWHASIDAELAQGFRCGNPDTTGTTWRRLVLTHP